MATSLLFEARRRTRYRPSSGEFSVDHGSATGASRVMAAVPRPPPTQKHAQGSPLAQPAYGSCSASRPLLLRRFLLVPTHVLEKRACWFGWWLMAGADLFWDKSTAGWLLMAGLFWEKSTAGWWLISQMNRALIKAAGEQVSGELFWTAGERMNRATREIIWGAQTPLSRHSRRRTCPRLVCELKLFDPFYGLLGVLNVHYLQK
jgi:hypothetical protein